MHPEYLHADSSSQESSSGPGRGPGHNESDLGASLGGWCRLLPWEEMKACRYVIVGAGDISASASSSVTRTIGDLMYKPSLLPRLTPS